MENKKAFSICDISDESPNHQYTKDTFKCGVCNIEKWSIDEYVSHMLEEEHCVMILENSRFLKDLKLPRFKRKIESKKYENVDEDQKVKSSYAVEIEIRKGVTRWKCRMCGLTFSREAAVMNHYKLAEHQIPGDDPSSTLKTESKENTQEIINQNSLTCNVEEQDDKLSLKTIKVQNSNPVCHICGQIFKSVGIVASHIKIVHSERRPFICSVKGCGLSFKTKGSLVRHSRRHTGDRPYKCNMCGRSYRESGSLLRHQQSKKPCDLKPDSHLPRYGITLPFEGVKSDETECKFSLKKEVGDEGTEEVPTEDPQEGEEAKAKVRKEILRNQGLMPAVSESFQTQEKKPLLKITKKEALSSDFDDEIVTKFEQTSSIDEENEDKILRRYFMCPLCYKSYTKMTYLSSHMKSHLAELGNECCTCKKKFSSDHLLARHLLTHSSARQFECRQCGKAFKLKSHALNHLKSHSSVKTIPCPECGCLFKSVSSRNTHRKIHSQERNFECSVCFKTFLVKASFLRHLKVHTRSNFIYSQVDRKISNKLEFEEGDSKSTIKCDVLGEEDANDLSEIDSELESFLSEKFDMSSIYSEQSDLSLIPEDYLLPRTLSDHGTGNNDLEREESSWEPIKDP